MAFNLGLNLDCSKWVATSLISAEEAEVRKVAWWGCYVVDKSVSAFLSLFTSVLTVKDFLPLVWDGLGLRGSPTSLARNPVSSEIRNTRLGHQRHRPATHLWALMLILLLSLTMCRST